MKNIKLFLPAFLLLASMSSCKEDLVEKVYGSVNDQNLWKSEADIQQVLNNGMNSIDMTWGYYTMHFMLMEDAATDYWVGGANAAGQFSNFSEWKTNYPDVFSWALWPHLWNSIYSANLVLDRIERIPGLTAEQKSRYIGEAKFMRAFNYYFAQNKFGGVPLVLSTTDMRESMPQNTRDEVRKQIEADLIEAMKSLPNKNAIGGDYSRPSKQAVAGLLARLYINWESLPDRWQKTSEACDAIINETAGLGLEFPYAKVFDIGNENNKEMVYAIKHDAKLSSGVFLFNDYFARPGDMKIPAPAQVSWGDWSVTQAFYDSFEPGDDRRKQLLTTYPATDGSTKAVTGNPIVVKYPLDPNIIDGALGGNDQPIIRFADILLMKAEAQNELGNISIAIGLVNQIRHRANLGDVSPAESASKESLREHIYQERRWEFFDEGLGRTDMIRFNKFLPWVAQKTGGAADPKYLIYPLHNEALSKNIGLVQNAGYIN